MNGITNSKSSNSFNEFHLVEDEIKTRQEIDKNLKSRTTQTTIFKRTINQSPLHLSLINKILKPKLITKTKRVQIKYYRKPKSKLFYIFILLGIINTSLYYGTISYIKKDVVSEKVYHSLSLGLIIIIDFLFLQGTIKENKDNSISELLLRTEENNTNIENDNNEYIFFIIIIGVLKFMTELNTFYLLEMTIDLGKNVAIGLALTAIEYTMISFHYSILKIKIEFSNFLGFLSTLVIMIIIVVQYLNISMLGLGLVVSALRFLSYYLTIQVNKQFNRKRVLIGYNFIDFILGILLFLIFFFLKKEEILFDTLSICMIFLATSAYYITLRYFSQLDK